MSSSLPPFHSALLQASRARFSHSNQSSPSHHPFALFPHWHSSAELSVQPSVPYVVSLKIGKRPKDWTFLQFFNLICRVELSYLSQENYQRIPPQTRLRNSRLWKEHRLGIVGEEKGNHEILFMFTFSSKKEQQVLLSICHFDVVLFLFQSRLVMKSFTSWRVS